MTLDWAGPARNPLTTHAGAFLDEGVGTGQVAPRAGSVEGGDPVQGAQVHTHTLRTNQTPGVWF